MRGDFLLNLFGQPRGSGDKIAACVWSMLGLCEQIGGDPAWIAAASQHDGLGRAGGQINRAIGTDDLLGGSDITIAGTKDLFHGFDAPGSIGQSGDGLGTTDARQARYAQQTGGGKQLVIGTGADNDDAFYAGNMRGDDGHDHSGKQSETPAGNVAADGLDGSDQLGDIDSGLRLVTTMREAAVFRPRGARSPRHARPRAKNPG